MFCENCGKELDENVSFCPGCGKNLKGGQNENAVNNGNSGGNEVYSGIAPLNGNGTGYNMPPNMPQMPYVQNPYIQPQQPTYVQPTIVNMQNPVETKSMNGLCIAGFVCSMIGFLFAAIIFGSAGTLFSIIGIATYDEDKHKGKWMGYVGIVAGLVNIVIGIFLTSIIMDMFGF